MPKNSLCNECGEKGRSVPRQTVLHHVKSEKLSRVGDDEYTFCVTPDCPVVYFAASGEMFTVSDVRELVTIKARGDERPLCYCFGFTKGDAREEITLTGRSTIPARISGFIKAGMCACEVRNPSGACCLGQVNKTVKKTVKRLSEEHETTAEPILVPSHNCCSV